jgi:glycosyltransferase involved in cell wall biosynthesis
VIHPKVSVLTITYNHERYIETALRSALDQRTSFPVEIIAGEDCSTDRTRAILLDLQRQFPDRIQLILQPENRGLMRNFADAFRACRGQYIALLEGDDYWTDPTKLQRQVEFLDAHPDCALCHHNALRIVEGSAAAPQTWHRAAARSRWQSVEEMCATNLVVSCTALFRGGLFGDLPDWFLECTAPDWALHILNAQHGRMYYQNAVMGAYRIHHESVWSTSPRITQLGRMIHNAKLIENCCTPSQQARLERSIQLWHGEILECLLREGRWEEARAHARSHLANGVALARLEAFFQGLELERAGKRWRADRQFLKALFTGAGQTRIGACDVLLALARTTFPRSYAAARDLWRRGASQQRS